MKKTLLRVVLPVSTVFLFSCGTSLSSSALSFSSSSTLESVPSSSSAESSTSSVSSEIGSKDIIGHIHTAESHLASYYDNSSKNSFSFNALILGEDPDSADYEKNLDEKKTIYDNYVSSSEILSTCAYGGGASSVITDSTELHYYDSDYNYYVVGIDHANDDNFYGSIAVDKDAIDKTDLDFYFKDMDFNEIAVSAFSASLYDSADLAFQGDLDGSFSFSLTAEYAMSYAQFFDGYGIFASDDWKTDFKATVERNATVNVKDGNVVSLMESMSVYLPFSVLTGESYDKPILVAYSDNVYADISCEDFGNYDGPYYHTVFFLPTSYLGTYINEDDTLVLSDITGANCSGAFNNSPLDCSYDYKVGFLQAFDIGCDNGDHYLFVKENEDGNLSVISCYALQKATYFSFDDGATLYCFSASVNEDGSLMDIGLSTIAALPEGVSLASPTIYQRA